MCSALLPDNGHWPLTADRGLLHSTFHINDPSAALASRRNCSSPTLELSHPLLLLLPCA